MQSLIHWIGAHTRYSENIPPLPPGADTVDEFLFGNRVGFCEQISTSLAVMLRSLGIPAREAVGYVPGSFNPITDLYQVHANDAHAWVQVWFPGYGWQDFDPTAAVPAEPPSPGATALHDVGSRPGPHPPGAGGRGRRGRRSGRRARALAPRPAGDVGGAGGAVASSVPAAAAGRPRRPSETLVEYAGRLDAPRRERGRPPGAGWPPSVEASAYGGRRPAPGDAARPRPGGQAGAGAATQRRRSGRRPRAAARKV